MEFPTKTCNLFLHNIPTKLLKHYRETVWTWRFVPTKVWKGNKDLINWEWLLQPCSILNTQPIRRQSINARSPIL